MQTTIADSGEVDRQFVYDPERQPELFADVRRRRLFAYLIDLVLIGFLVLIGWAVIGILGIVTLGLGWLFFGISAPATALIYIALTLGGARSATPGMRMMGLEMRLWYGARPYMLLAVMHTVLFYTFNTLLTPLIVAVSLFNERKRLLHDIVLGTVVINVPDEDSDGLAATDSAAP